MSTVAQPLNGMVRSREGRNLLATICAASGEDEDEALITALRLYHRQLADAHAADHDFGVTRNILDASSTEVLALMGHV